MLLYYTIAFTFYVLRLNVLFFVVKKKKEKRKKKAIASVGVAAQRAKSAIFLLHIHSTQEAFSWHIDYSIHYVMHGYIHLLHREDQARLSLPVKLHVLVWENPSFVLSRKPGDEATRAIAEAQAEVAGARAPVCHSLATPLHENTHRALSNPVSMTIWVVHALHCGLIRRGCHRGRMRGRRCHWERM